MSKSNLNAVLVKNGKSDHVVVVDKLAPPAVNFAARELVGYFMKMSGAMLPISDGNDCLSRKQIQIKAHPQKMANNCRDQFTIKWEGENLVLEGSNPRSALFAVYALLEILGCRWFYPGESEEIIPRKKRITLGKINLREQASMEYRGMAPYPQGTKDVPMLQKMIDWMAKNRMNLCMFSLAHGDAGWDDVKSELLPELKKRDFILNVGAHCLMKFAQPEKWFSEKPEWFALKKERVNDDICHSRKEIIDIVSDNIVDFLNSHPEIDILSLWPTDGITGLCECEKCSAFSATDLLLKTTKQIKQNVVRHKPKIKIEFLAYYIYSKPPSKAQPDADLIINYAPRGHSYEYAFDSPTNPYCNRLKGYIKSCQKNGASICVFEYYADNVLQKLMVAPMARRIFEDIRHFKAMGVGGMLPICVSIYCWWMNCFNLRMMAKAAWNASADVEEILADYLKKYYGVAGAEMRRYFLTLEKIVPAAIWRYDESHLPALREVESRLRVVLKRIESRVILKRVGRALVYLQALEQRLLLRQREIGLVAGRLDDEKSMDLYRRKYIDFIEKHRRISGVFDPYVLSHHTDGWDLGVRCEIIPDKSEEGCHFEMKTSDKFKL
ncbi:MAG: DUF4838 domain-containing protein [Verrucomicrobiae bacterium]|nr:DUF4838 domain-containing protein [Verrucomicrobiae bacterium]